MIQNLTTEKTTTPIEKKAWMSPDLCLISSGYVNGGPVASFHEHSFVNTTTTGGGGHKINFVGSHKSIPAGSLTPAKTHGHYHS